MCPLRAVERKGQMRWWVWKFFANCKRYKIGLKDRGPSLWQFPMWKMRMLDQSILDLPGLQDTGLRLSKAETPSSPVSSHWDSWEITFSSRLRIHRCRNQSTKSHGQKWGIPIPSSAPVTVARTLGRAGVQKLLEGLCPPTQKCREDRSSLGWSRVEEKPAHKMFALLIPSGTKGLQTASCLCPTQQSSSCVSLRSSGQLGHVPLYLCFPSFPASLSSFPLACCPEITLPDRTLAQELCLRFWVLGTWVKQIPNVEILTRPYLIAGSDMA